MKHILLILSSIFLVNAMLAQGEIQVGLRLLPGLAYNQNIDIGDLGMGVYAGYQYRVTPHFSVQAGTEISTTAWAGQILLEVGGTWYAWENDKLELGIRGSFHPGWIWYRENAPFITGLSTGLSLHNKSSGKWSWSVSPGIRRLQSSQYSQISTINSLTDIELRIGIGYMLGKALPTSW